MAAKKKPADGDSPIKVGGGGGKRPKGLLIGSFYCEFNHGVYIADPQEPDNSVTPKLVLDYVAVFENGVEATRRQGNNKVEVKYHQDGTLGTDKIVINKA